MSYQISPGAYNTGIYVGSKQIPQQPPIDPHAVINAILNKKDKIQPLLDEFYLTQEGKMLQQGYKGLEAFLYNNSHRL